MAAELAPELQDKLEELEKELEVRFVYQAHRGFYFSKPRSDFRPAAPVATGCFSLKSRLIIVMAPWAYSHFSSSRVAWLLTCRLSGRRHHTKRVRPILLSDPATALDRRFNANCRLHSSVPC